MYELVDYGDGSSNPKVLKQSELIDEVVDIGEQFLLNYRIFNDGKLVPADAVEVVVDRLAQQILSQGSPDYCRAPRAC